MTNAATQRISLRSTEDAKNVIQEAADLLGIPLSSFMLQVAFERAKDLIKNSQEIKLNSSDRDLVMNLLENPVTPNNAMKELMRLNED